MTPVPKPVPRPVQKAVSSILRTPETEMNLQYLAREMSKGITASGEVLKTVGMTEKDYATLCTTRFFKQMLQVAQMEWSATHNTSQRVKFKAQTSIEEALPPLHKALIDPTQPLSARAALLAQLARLADIGPKESAIAPGNGQMFKLEIHLDKSENKPPIIINASTDPVPAEEVFYLSPLLAHEPLEIL